MWDKEIIAMLLEGTADTLYMTLMSTLFGYVLGLPMGIVLAVTDKEGIRPNGLIYKILDFIANLIRSIPFFNTSDSCDYGDKGNRRQKLRTGCYRGAACNCGGSFYCPYGRVILKRGG